jgi:hypothetical protein
MYYAYQSSTPSHIIEKYHLLAMNPIKGPKIRCDVPDMLEIYDAQPKLSAIDHLKNYPRNSISQSQVKDSILSKTRIHISLDNDDDIETGITTYINEKWKEGSGGHMNDIFSQSIMNSDFNSHEKSGSVWARYSLKQLWEECCAEVDDIGPDGVKELEERLLSFRGYCNQIKSSAGSNQLGSGKHSITTPPRRNIPLTGAKYGGSAERVFNTHNM